MKMKMKMKMTSDFYMHNNMVKFKYYNISSKGKETTFKDLTNQILTKSPETPYAASCWWNVKMVKKRYVLKATITLPRIRGPPLKHGVRKQWDTWHKPLKCHELGHLMFGRLYRDTMNEFLKTKPTPTQRKEHERRVHKHLAKEERGFDRKTQHGLLPHKFTKSINHVC